MSTERKRKVSLFDVMDEASVSDKLAKVNGAFSSKPAAVPAGINRWNGRPYSQRYYEILEKRKTLPVWQQKEEFLQVLKANQTLILVGETGSGKTTQVCSTLFDGSIFDCNSATITYMILNFEVVSIASLCHFICSWISFIARFKVTTPFWSFG